MKTSDSILSAMLCAASAVVQLPLHVVEQPAFYIAVVPDMVGGRLSSHDKDLLGLANKLAGEAGAVVAESGGMLSHSSIVSRISPTRAASPACGSSMLISNLPPAFCSSVDSSVSRSRFSATSFSGSAASPEMKPRKRILPVIESKRFSCVRCANSTLRMAAVRSYSGLRRRI